VCVCVYKTAGDIQSLGVELEDGEEEDLVLQ